MGRKSEGNRVDTRAGVSAVDLMVAIALVCVLTTVCGQLLFRAVRMRAEDRKRSWALQEAANVMEALFARPYETLKPGLALEQTCSVEAKTVLGEATVRQEVEACGDGRRLKVTVSWSQSPGTAAGRTILVAFRYPKQGQHMADSPRQSQVQKQFEQREEVSSNE